MRSTFNITYAHKQIPGLDYLDKKHEKSEKPKWGEVEGTHLTIQEKKRKEAKLT